MKNIFKKINLLGVAALMALASSGSMAGVVTENISNGGFETGDFSGWTISETGNDQNNFYIVSGNNSPVSQHMTPGAASGNYYAVSDQNGPGSQTLSQDFTIISGQNVALSFDMFVASHASFDSTNQYSRVDIIQDNTVIENLYLDAPNESSYAHYMYDITSAVGAGGNYTLQFKSLQNNFFQEQGVDNVSITTTAAVPEPETYAMVLAGLGALCFVTRRRMSFAKA